MLGAGVKGVDVEACSTASNKKRKSLQIKRTMISRPQQTAHLKQGTDPSRYHRIAWLVRLEDPDQEYHQWDQVGP